MSETIRLRDTEAAHAQLFSAHRHLVSAADSVHAVLMAMLDRERYSDEREAIAPFIANLRSVREQINGALHEAGSIRSDLINKTGCNGRCKNAEADDGIAKAPTE